MSRCLHEPKPKPMTGAARLLRADVQPPYWELSARIMHALRCTKGTR
jgi:hypothetical protein